MHPRGVIGAKRSPIATWLSAVVHVLGTRATGPPGRASSWCKAPPTHSARHALAGRGGTACGDPVHRHPSPTHAPPTRPTCRASPSTGLAVFDTAAPRASAGCSGYFAASRSGPPDPQSGTPQQPEHLTALQPQPPRRRLGRQSSLIQIPQHLEPRQLPIARQPNRHPRHPPEIPRAVSSVIGRGVTFSSGAYTAISQKPIYCLFPFGRCAVECGP
jgi:hypothetical protein